MVTWKLLTIIKIFFYTDIHTASSYSILASKFVRMHSLYVLSILRIQKQPGDSFVTFLSPIWRSRFAFEKGHLTIPKRSPWHFEFFVSELHVQNKGNHHHFKIPTTRWQIGVLI